MPTVDRVRPNRSTFAKRMSTWLTRSPYRVPGSMRFTVIVGLPRPANGRFRPTVALFGALQLAASCPPGSLRSVPETCTSTFGMTYEPSAVMRVIHPDDVSHQGLVGDCARMTVHSGMAVLTSQ